MEKNYLSWIRFLVVSALILTKCSSQNNCTERIYSIVDKITEKEYKVIESSCNDSTKDNAWIKLKNKTDSLVSYEVIQNDKKYKLTKLTKKSISINKGDSVNILSFYLIVDFDRGRQFYWGVNLDKQETIYLTNTDGREVLKLINKKKGSEQKKYIPYLKYIDSVMLAPPPLPKENTIILDSILELDK